MLLKATCNLSRLLSQNKILRVIPQNRNLSKMSKTALVCIAPGTEETECVITVDVLRRGGVKVTLAGILGDAPVECSRGVVINPDISILSAKGPYDAVVLPGGLGGSKIFCDSEEVGKLLKTQESEGRIIAAICAAPTALQAHEIHTGKKLTSYPSVSAPLEDMYEYRTDKVVVDGQLITSRGPGTAFDFALRLLEKLEGKEKAADVAKGMLLKY